MKQVSEYQLKKSFRQSFPEHSKLLDAATSQEQIDELHTQFVAKAKDNMKSALKYNGVSDEYIKILSTIPADQTVAITLSPEHYNTLINARKGEILNELHVLIDGLTRLQKLDSSQIGLATAWLVGIGMLSIGLLASRTAIKALLAGGTEVEAVLAGVTALTVVSLIAIVTFVIILVLIPILFYMQKPANCVIALLNELDEEITFENDYNVHGQPKLMTTPITEAVTVPGFGTYAVCGLIATAKTKNSLYGTQYGFTMKTKNGISLSYGVENPLTSLYKDNNCYCEIGTTAEDVAKKTDKHNKQEWHMTKGGITLEIRCNSGVGSTAYYIARAYKTPEV